MRLTGGTITYSERRTIAQYEHKECKVEIAFAFADGEMDVPSRLQEIQDEIRSRCLVMLGLSAPAAVKPVVAQNATAAETGPFSGPRPEPTKERKPRVAKAKPPVAAVDADPTDPVEEAAPPASEPDELDLLLTAPTAITDVDLTEAAKIAAVRLKNAVPVREVIGRFTPKVGQACSMIPADKRQQFLDELAALK